MSRAIFVRDVQIGGGAPVTVQSMCNTYTSDAKKTLAQIAALHEVGCEIVRVAVPDFDAANALRQICAHSLLPVVADIHFDHRLALAALDAGVDKVRINPGNIGDSANTRAVAEACRARKVPIRVGVNSGSISAQVRARLGSGADALVESALENVRALEQCGFEDICVSLKASDVFRTIEAYRAFARQRDYPLHLGVTEAGSVHMGTVKSAAAFGALLCDGIGDTIRVSLTDDPVREIEAARDILAALGMNRTGVTVISCPTCGRTRVDLIPLARQVEQHVKTIDAKLTVAVMGCAVNGPGEAREADFGVACGNGEGLIFRKGEILYKVPESELLGALLREIEKAVCEKDDPAC